MRSGSRVTKYPLRPFQAYLHPVIGQALTEQVAEIQTQAGGRWH